MTAATSYLIAGGTVHDGSAAPVRADVRIRDGHISEIGPDLRPGQEQVFDATGLHVMPGLIDLHTHVYGGMGIFSVCPEEAGLRTGVTTLVDTGSAGALNYGTFRRYVMEQAEEDIFAYLNIAQYGVQGHPDIDPFLGDLHEIRHLHAGSAVACIKKYPDRIVGMKVRLTASLAEGKIENEYAGLNGAVEAASRTGLRCMVHHTASGIPISTVLETLRPGDVYTHMYNGRAGRGFDEETGAPHVSQLRARERGIFFDVGHGVGSFGWHVAEPACQKYGFWPDTISTDIHQFNLNGPVWDMATTMSKFLYLGWPLADVVRASTSAPAKALGKQDTLGHLKVGRSADVTVLRLDEGSFPLLDIYLKVRMGRQRLVPVAAWKRGVFHKCEAAPVPEVPRE
jgi:dihydroorotase